jgi:hypothetical protein
MKTWVEFYFLIFFSADTPSGYYKNIKRRVSMLKIKTPASHLWFLKWLPFAEGSLTLCNVLSNYATQIDQGLYNSYYTHSMLACVGGEHFHLNP